MIEETRPAGWYPDPEDHLAIRYWDGKGWTGHAAEASSSGGHRAPVEPTPTGVLPPVVLSQPTVVARDKLRPHRAPGKAVGPDPQKLLAVATSVMGVSLMVASWTVTTAIVGAPAVAQNSAASVKPAVDSTHGKKHQPADGKQEHTKKGSKATKAGKK